MRPLVAAHERQEVVHANTGTERVAGISFPESSEGKRSSTDTAKHIFAEAVRRIDPQAAGALLAERQWRQRYPAHLVHQVKLAARDADTATNIAADGLEAVHNSFEFVRDGVASPLAKAMDESMESPFRTATVHGKSQFVGPPLDVPYRGERLVGDRLLRQLDVWCSRGITEPSHAEAIRTVMHNPDWLDLSDRTFLLLGAASEIGPLSFLAAHRANIVAVDLNRPRLWTRILELVARSPCVLHAPVRTQDGINVPEDDFAKRAGADLLRDTPELAAWLERFENPAAIGCYAYLDGKDHVTVAVAMDALVQRLHAKASRAAFAYLASPTDAFAVPEETARRAHERFGARGAERLWQSPARWITRQRLYAPNIPDWVTSATGERYGIYDGLVIRQGPNYALAKRIQKWRALTVRTTDHRVSANVAPPSMTNSVTSSRAFAAAYAGARHYGAEIFAPETTNALMGALLVYDLCSEESVANPRMPLAHPLELFMSGANHGGLWRSPMQIRSVLDVAAVRGFLSGSNA
ncbi:MAG: hypothetical protein WAU39_19690 [Polyangiales bacterium]